jgi:sulfite dehydrogenase (quinone) subunit SoeC
MGNYASQPVFATPHQIGQGLNMHPAFSILFFTTLAGAAQGLVVVLALATLMGVSMSASFLLTALGIGEALLIAGLASSFLHLGHKMRAWRAVLMWRTSWMSREVIILPAFIGLVGLWWLALYFESNAAWANMLPVVIVLASFALWYCTAMIYACIRFIEEWAHSLTIVNFTLVGLASGMVLACALAALAGQAAFLKSYGLLTLALVLTAWCSRVIALRRNSALRHKSTLQSATGIHSGKLVQKSMGMSAGAFNTREFFHGASTLAVRNVRLGFQVLGFALPALCIAWGWASGGTLPWVAALIVQAPGVLAERWYFFAQAKHPQNLYYQTVS